MAAWLLELPAETEVSLCFVETLGLVERRMVDHALGREWWESGERAIAAAGSEEL